MRWLKAAGTRPEPAVSVPRANGTTARGDHHRRSGTGSAAHVFAIEYAAQHAVGTARADQTRGELIEVGLADYDRARPRQAFNDRSGALGPIGEFRTGRGRRKTCHIDIVLDRHRHAGQRQRLTGRDPFVNDRGLCQEFRVAKPADPRLWLNLI